MTVNSTMTIFFNFKNYRYEQKERINHCRTSHNSRSRVYLKKFNFSSLYVLGIRYESVKSNAKGILVIPFVLINVALGMESKMRQVET